MRAYEDAIRATTSDEAPWFVVPADRKWWAGAIISTIMVHALESMKLTFPALSPEARRDLKRIRQELRGD